MFTGSYLENQFQHRRIGEAQSTIRRWRWEASGQVTEVSNGAENHFQGLHSPAQGYGPRSLSPTSVVSGVAKTASNRACAQE